MLSLLQAAFLPHTVVLLRSPGEKGPPLGELASYTAAMEAEEGEATAYLCSGGVCRLPTRDSGELMRMLGTTKREVNH
jgi:uncharacterized protein YyaL (SSP411 family)